MNIRHLLWIIRHPRDHRTISRRLAPDEQAQVEEATARVREKVFGRIDKEDGKFAMLAVLTAATVVRAIVAL